MTTNELIVDYGIGNNCLSDAYALGLMHGLDAIKCAVQLAEKQARDDAIDEYKKKIEFEYKWLLDCKVFDPNVEIAFGTIISHADDLREKKE